MAIKVNSNIKQGNMLDYVKLILRKVSFDSALFEKELRKAICALVEHEVEELKNWCYSQFYETHSGILNKCFIYA